MDAFATAIGAVLMGAAFLFALSLLATLGGAFGGWVTGLFFEETILGTLRRAGVDTHGLSMWQLGATLGFIGGFFKSVTLKG